MPVLRIESVDNPRIKSVSMLVKDRGARVKSGLAVIENAVMVEEALSCGVTLKQVFFDEKNYQSNALLAEKCASFGAEVFTVTERVMKKLTALEAPQGVTAVFEMKSMPKADISKKGRYILCERMSDPGNLGTVIRTADAMGFDGVILSKGSVDVYSPKVMRATMGSIFRTPVLTDIGVTEAVDRLKSSGNITLAAVLNPQAKPADEIEVTDCVAILIGNEAAGLSEEAINAADKCVYIPMSGKAESLNAAVAASVFMWIFRKK